MIVRMVHVRYMGMGMPHRFVVMQVTVRTHRHGVVCVVVVTVIV